MSDWEDAYDNDKEIKTEKVDTRADEILTLKEEKPKVVANTNFSAKPKEAEKPKQPSQPLKEMTQEEIDEEIRLNQQKEFAMMFGSDTAKSIVEITLQKDEDILNFAKVIGHKVSPCTRKQIIYFMKSLATEVSTDLRDEDINEIHGHLINIINGRKTTKGRAKKKNDAPSMKTAVGVGKDTKNQLLRDFKGDSDESFEEVEDYRGKNENMDFM